MILTFSLLTGIIIACFFKYNLQIKMFLYSKNWCLWWVKEEDIDHDKKYDIFLSFCHKDKEFVMSEIVPHLECTEKPYKVCIHFRNWEVGEWIHKNIERSVKESRCTVIIMLQYFLKSYWGMLEFRMAYHQMFADKRLRLVVVKYGEIDSTGMLNPELQQYFQMNTFVEWCDPYFWKKFLYLLPRSVDHNDKQS